jgi:hypothetical protein
MVFSRYRPRGRSAEALMRSLRLERSEVIESRMPGNWTLTATVRPSLRTALCTWPMDAAATGLLDQVAKASRQAGPRAEDMTELSCQSGM